MCFTRHSEHQARMKYDSTVFYKILNFAAYWRRALELKLLGEWVDTTVSSLSLRNEDGNDNMTNLHI